MAEKYHISPSTGNPNRCYAKKACPLGASEAEHYSSKEEARAAYEKQSEEYFTALKKDDVAKKQQNEIGESKQTLTSKKSAVKDELPPTDEAEEDWESDEEIPDPDLSTLAAEEVPLDNDFSDIKCDDCGHPLDQCTCGECEYCGAFEGDEHYDDCPLYKPVRKAYSWD